MTKKFNDELTHWGVLGMHWGSKKDPRSPEYNNSVRKARLLALATKANEKAETFRKQGKIKQADRWQKEADFQTKMSETQITRKTIGKIMAANLKNAWNSPDEATRIRTRLRVISLVVSTIGVGRVLRNYYQIKRYQDLANKFGGFDPKVVVNAKFK